MTVIRNVRGKQVALTKLLPILVERRFITLSLSAYREATSKRERYKAIAEAEPGKARQQYKRNEGRSVDPSLHPDIASLFSPRVTKAFFASPSTTQLCPVLASLPVAQVRISILLCLSPSIMNCEVCGQMYRLDGETLLVLVLSDSAHSALASQKEVYCKWWTRDVIAQPSIVGSTLHPCKLRTRLSSFLSSRPSGASLD